jgi:MFS family permease
MVRSPSQKKPPAQILSKAVYAGERARLSSFFSILRSNRNYRSLWLGQTVSEIGDHFNTIAVLSLSLRITGSGFGVGMVMIARILPAILAGPVAGIVLDRVDRRRVMLTSDLLRAVVALLHIFLLTYPRPWLMYVLSGLLMFASPFFTAGRSAILPKITNEEELHTANALTQTTSWLTLTIGALLGGISTMQFGYEWAFVANAGSFLISALAVWNLHSPDGHFRPLRHRLILMHRPNHWEEFRAGLSYMWTRPLIFAIGLTGVGWALGGGAAQVLFTLFGELVFQRGPAGIGLIWSFAGVGLVLGGVTGHRVGRKLPFAGYKRLLTVSFLLHGLAYVAFALMPTIWYSLIFITLSRVSMGLNNVLNRTVLLTHVPDGFRGRVFTTVDTMLNSTMMISLGLAAWATAFLPIRQIGVIAGVLSSLTAIGWAWADATGRLVEPPREEMAEEIDLIEPVTPA